jgi:hypothetical protein
MRPENIYMTLGHHMCTTEIICMTTEYRICTGQHIYIWRYLNYVMGLTFSRPFKPRMQKFITASLYFGHHYTGSYFIRPLFEVEQVYT